MKAIILIALLALTQAAVTFNITSYHLGFTDQLGLNATQLQVAEDCYADAQQFNQDVQKVIVGVQDQDGHEIAGALIDLISAADDTMNGACATYKEDLLAIFTQNANGTDLKTLAEQNYGVYPTQVIQQVALWLQYFAEGDQYNAGKTEAYILQILFGLETPEVLPAPVFNSSNYVPIDMNKYIPELYKGVYNTIGINNQTLVDELSTCVLSYLNTMMAITELPSNITDDITHDIHVYSDLVEKLAETVDTCAPVAKFSWDYNKKLFEIFFASPFLNAGRIVFNIAKNLPEIVQESQIATVDILEGYYYQAGVVEGEISNTFFDGVFNFTEIFGGY